MVKTAGYQLLIAAGSSLIGAAMLDSDDEPSDGDLAQFLSANAEALEQARRALRQDCAVPLEYEACFFEKQCENYLQWLADLPDDQRHQFAKQLDHRNLALMRLLGVESALTAFHARNGAYPRDLSSLSPDYIVTIPSDPFTGAPFKYRNTAGGFALYSPGPTGHDCGGNGGDWFSVLSGQADLGLDMCE